MTDVEQTLILALKKEQAENNRLRKLLAEAAWYVERYGDDRKDRQYYLRFNAAAQGKEEPEEEA